MAMLEITELLERMLESGASDIYIASGDSPRMNVEGTLQDLTSEPLSPEAARQIIRQRWWIRSRLIHPTLPLLAAGNLIWGSRGGSPLPRAGFHAPSAEASLP